MYYVEVWDGHLGDYVCHLATPDKAKAERAKINVEERGYYARIIERV